MVRKKKKKEKGKLFWIGLAIAIILLIILYGFVVKKRLVVDPGLMDAVPDEGTVSMANSGAGAELFEHLDESNGIGAGGLGGGSGGGSGSDDSYIGEIVPPPVIPKVYDE